MTFTCPISRSIKVASDLAQVKIVMGDTNVVDRGKEDSLFINISGIGILEHPLKVAHSSIQIGVAILRSDRGLSSATAIGKVVETPSPVVILNSKLGTTRILDLLSGEQLPRIC